jgi:hypothetical protein
MQTKANIFKGQWGGSTLIGLLLGLCLGMLALIKWPQLEVPIKALLAEHDIQIETDVESDKRLRPNLPMPGDLAHDRSKSSVPSATHATSERQSKEGSSATAYLHANNSTAPLIASEPRSVDFYSSASRADNVYSDNASTDVRRALALVTDTGTVDNTSDVRMTTSAAAPAIKGLAQNLEPDTSRYETREVWQAFSSESAAKAFAATVSNALNIEVDTLRQSDHKIVPIVRCEERGTCDAMSAEITAFLAGPTDLGVYDDI